MADSEKAKSEYILITSQNFPSGGAGATYLNLFCRGLKLNGYAIEVFLLKGFAFGNFSRDRLRRNTTDYGVPFTYLGLIRRPENGFLKFIDDFLSIIRLMLVLLSVFRKRRSVCLLIYNNELQSNLLIYPFARLTGTKLITFVPEFYDRSDFRTNFFRRLKWYGFLINFKRLNRRSDGLIVFSFYLKEQYVKDGFEETRIIVQPNLTDFEYWKPDGRNNIKYTLGYCGAPYIKDGIVDLFRSIRSIQDEGIRVSLLVIGDSTFGKSLLPGLKTCTRDLDISQNVVFTGLVEADMVKQYLSECKILVLTRPLTVQTKAGFPTKLGEYFACQKPVLATDFGDISGYFKDGTEIVLAEAGNPGSIASKIKWMIQNYEASEQISHKGYVKGLEVLDYRNAIIKLIQFIEHL